MRHSQFRLSHSQQMVALQAKVVQDEWYLITSLKSANLETKKLCHSSPYLAPRFVTSI